MLQKIQQRLSGWVLWFFVIIISLGFLLWGTDNYFKKSTNQKYDAIGTVNGVDILSHDVQRVFNVIASQLAQRNNNTLPEYMHPIIKDQAVNAVIFNTIISTLSKKHIIIKFRLLRLFAVQFLGTEVWNKGLAATAEIIYNRKGKNRKDFLKKK